MMNYFNLLPPEIISSIFKKLNSNDLINLRIVDKRFKEICEQTKIKQLIVSNELDNYYQPFWFYTNDPIYLEENLIELSKFQNYAKIFQLDKHLKRLTLIMDSFNFSILNKFKLLEQFEIMTDELIDNYKLSLDNLKIVNLNNLNNFSDFKLTFDTIKLIAIKLKEKNSNNVVFNYPDKIQFIKMTYDSNWRSLYDNFLKNFNNLQYLKLYYFKGPINSYVLSQLKNLKILNLSIPYNQDYSEFDTLVNEIKFIIDKKENLKISELDIYLFGLHLIDQTKIEQFKSEFRALFGINRLNGRRLIRFQIKNYDLLKDNCYIEDINYCDLIESIKIIPSSFKNKFPFIHRVEAHSRINDEDQFIKFLNNLQYLSRLELRNCELSKLFYDKLINLVYLNDLKGLVINEKKDLEMNFNFILNSKKLKSFQTNQIIANHIDLTDKLFKKNRVNNLSILFKFDIKNYISISKQHNHPFKIRSYYLANRLTNVDNFYLELRELDDVVFKLKELKF